MAAEIPFRTSLGGGDDGADGGGVHFVVAGYVCIDTRPYFSGDLRPGAVRPPPTDIANVKPHPARRSLL